MNPLLKLLNSNNPKIVEFGILLEQIHNAIDNKSITQSECDDLLADVSRKQSLIEDSISLDLRITINKALGELYNVVLMAKNLLPL